MPAMTSANSAPSEGHSLDDLIAANWDPEKPAETPQASAPDSDEFDPYSLADEARDREVADLRERAFRAELKALAPGIDGDPELAYAAADALERKGAEVTPETLATEYKRLRSTVDERARQRIDRDEAKKRSARTTGVGGGSRPPGAPVAPQRKTYPSLVEVIKKDQHRRNLYRC